MSVNKAINSLQEIRMELSTWDSDEACHQLAKLLARAHGLANCSISDQQGEQQIKVIQEKTSFTDDGFDMVIKN